MDLKYLIYGFICFITLGCHESTPKSNSISHREFKDEKNDSSLNTSDSSKQDTYPHENYPELNHYFNIGKDVQPERIPYMQISKYLNGAISDTTSTFYKGVFAIDHFRNKYGNFYLVELICTAGGDCGIYYLISFNREGDFKESIKIGEVSAEEDESKLFEYKLFSDTVLTIYQIRYDNNLDKPIDTIKLPVQLKVKVK